jgi:hypothetical protein
MAKKQSNASIFERAGYNLAASNLPSQQRVNYTKAILDGLQAVKIKNKKQEEENPYGLPYDKMSGNASAATKDFILGISDNIKQLSLIKEGDIDPETNEPYNIEDVRDQIDQLKFQIENHSDHLETKIGMAAAARERGKPGNAATAEQKTNWELLTGKRFGADGLQQRLNTDTGEYEYFDATVGKHVPISEFNIGSVYDPKLADLVNANEEQVRNFATNPSIRKEPALWDVSEAQLMSDMEDFLEKNPDAAKNLLFEDKKFKSYLNSLIPVDPSDTDQYNAAIELLKQNKDSTGETIEIDYNEILLEGYKKMINNTFENSLVPVPESVSNNNKSLGDFPAATDAEIKTNKDKYESTDENVETETTETPEEKQPVTIAQQMLNTKRPSASGIKAYNKFNKKELRNALSSGEIDEEILKKYLVQIPGVSILEGEVKGLENVSARDFNSAMRKLQQETEINLGYNI